MFFLSLFVPDRSIFSADAIVRYRLKKRGIKLSALANAASDSVLTLKVKYPKLPGSAV
jgi:hypothetical protein